VIRLEHRRDFIGFCTRPITTQSAPTWASFGVDVVIAAALSPKDEDAASRKIVHA
jgi:hypothetical protein